MDEDNTESVSGDGGRDDTLHEILVARGWRSDRAVLSEEGDRFEWPPSSPIPLITLTDEPVRCGTTIHVDVAGYEVYGPQTEDTPVQPRASYSTRDALLLDLCSIEDWR